MNIKSPAVLRAALAARRAAQAAAKKPAAAPRPSAPDLRQRFGVDELSRGRGGALRSPSAAAKLGAMPTAKYEGARFATSKSTRAGEVRLTPGTLSASVSGGFSTTVKSANGWGLSFGLDAQTSVVSNLQTQNGVTSYTVTGDASVTLSGGLQTPHAGLALAHSEGIEVEYSVSMPEEAAREVDPKTVNPFDPGSMPTGTVVTLDGSHYASNEFSATFKHLALETKVTNASGVSVVIEKTGENTVRVTAGPTEAVEAYGGIGVDLGVASAKLGREDAQRSATLKTAEFDLSTPEGQAAYDAFLATGALPSQKGPGVMNVATIEKDGKTSHLEGSLKLGPLEVSFESAAFVSSTVTTTSPDGSVDALVTLDMGGLPLELTLHYGPDGKELVSERRYTYTLTTDESSVNELNLALGGLGDDPEADLVKPGKTVMLTFTEAQMKAFLQQAQAAAATASGGQNNLLMALREIPFSSPEAFARHLLSLGGGNHHSLAQLMFAVAGLADGQSIEATVTAP